MRRLLVGLCLLGVAVGAPAATAEVLITELLAADVVVERGADLDSAQRARLEAAASSLRARRFETKFVVIARTDPNPEATAKRLRAAVARDVGLVNIDAVLVLGPRQLGLAAEARPQDHPAAFDRQAKVFLRDPVGVTINIARLLQRFAPAAAAPAAPTSETRTVPVASQPEGDGRTSTWLVVVGGLAAVLAVVAVAFARRRSTRR